MDDFKDQVVLVTGAGRGLGRAIAEAFAARGAVVAANDLTPVNLDETVLRILAAGGRAHPYVFDVAKRLPVQAMVEGIVDNLGRIDILINNAGVEPHAPILDMDEWDWQRTLDVNLSGPFFAMQHAGRAMRQQGGGIIVNIASIAGRAHGLKDRSAYVASKQGLIGLTREAAREFAAYNIRVNAVCPGVIETEMTAALRQDAQMVARWLADIPQGRLGVPQDVVDVVLFLCSPAASLSHRAGDQRGWRESDVLAHTGPLDELYGYRDLLLEHCAAAVQEYRAVIEGLPLEDWHTPLPPDGWTPHQLLAHLRAVEVYALEPCIRRMAGQDPSCDPSHPFTDFDPRQWMRQRYDPAEPPEQILAAYARARQAELDTLSAMPDAAWSQVARHPMHGLRTLQWWVERALVHSRHHLEQLRTVIGDQ